MRPIVKAITMSENRKLGKASTTHAAQASCPSDCVFMNAGCYAERGPLGAFVLAPLNDAAKELGASGLDVAEAEAKAIDEMAVVVGRPLRLHTVGDCASDDAALLVAAASERYEERGGGRVWSYTHAWRNVKRSSWTNVSILASCETAADVQKAKERGYATAIVVDEFPGDELYTSEEGIKILPCPSQTKKGVTCADCRLCFNDAGIRERDYSIGFAIHGDRVTQDRARTSLTSHSGIPESRKEK